LKFSELSPDAEHLKIKITPTDL